jgi:soluble lytic murein transglycosylase-like protein
VGRYAAQHTCCRILDPGYGPVGVQSKPPRNVAQAAAGYALPTYLRKGASIVSTVRAHFFMLLAFATCSGIAHADIYRLVDANGVTIFTNIPPEGRDQLYLKERLDSVSQEPGNEGRGHIGEKRSRYTSTIQEAAQANNVEPALIHAVIAAESGYDSFARSSKGAVGLMQLMPETARRYSVTNRLDPAQNIHGGTRYLRDLLRMFDNDLRLVVAAYNAGEQAVVKYGNRVPPYRETVEYVPRVMAYYRKYRAGS